MNQSGDQNMSNTSRRPLNTVQQMDICLTSSTPKANNCNNQPDDQSIKVDDTGKKLLVGNVEQVQRIIDLVKVGSNKCERIFCLHSENKKSRIVCVFYEIDRKMPNIPEGTLVLCTGHKKGINKLQIFCIRELHQEDRNSFNRISLVSQWAINDMTIYNKM